MTKEEILHEINKKMVIEAGFDPFFFTFEEFIRIQNEDEDKKELVEWAKRAMDEYAKQQAIAFGSFLQEQTGDTFRWLSTADQLYDQFYDQFIEQQQNK